ncbi:arginine--tRNA ligase [Buchnera aphidicola (Kurisakia onigurumii)]|uniref:arginine--tRNA ligase n=1 Tax=Buchnera aphidicola TaxID=9 RepID=UPI0031B6D692
MNIKKILYKTIIQSFEKIGINKKYDPIISRTNTEYRGQYQANGIIKISKIEKKDPKKLSNKIINLIKSKKIFKKVFYTKPGFINFIINPEWISEKLNIILKKNNLHIKKKKKETIVIDYSSPNIAKEMHIGHLRSTVLGDSFAKLASFLGHKVIKVNHIGDWGTNFGIILAFYKEKKINLSNLTKNLKNIEKHYIIAKKKFDNDKKFANLSQKYNLKLNKNNINCKKIWKKIVSYSIKKNNVIYKKLNISLKNKHIKGESAYHHMLPEIIEDLLKKKIAKKIDGSVVVILKKFKNRIGKPMGIIIQKKDSSFLYSTIDIACLKYRCSILNANRIIYYTDSRQSQYLQQIILIAKMAGYIPNNTIIEHHTFGMVLSKNNKPFKTRDGNNIKLIHLIKEAEKRAYSITKTKNSNLKPKEIISISKKIGIGSIKYSDLSKNRITNYIFDWKTMLTFEGNTAPYMQYTFTRITSIFNKISYDIKKIKYPIILLEKYETELSLKILQFEEIIDESFKKGYMHLLCLYLYNLSVHFSIFYEQCPILKNSNKKIKYSRIKLCFLTSTILKIGLKILGIPTINFM